MFRLPFFSLLFLALLNLVAASSVTYWKSDLGYWYYHGEVRATSEAQLKGVVAQAYKDMVADVEQVNKAGGKTYKTPSMMTGIFDGSTITLGSSVQGYTGNVANVPSDFPPALKAIMAKVTPDQCHRHEGLCSEPMALATYVLKKGGLPDSTTSKVATYGRPPNANQASEHNPCSADSRGYGCKELLNHLALSYFPRTPAAGTSRSGRHRREIANEIRSLMIRVRDLQTFDNYLAKREFLMIE